jgi:lipopolysaccharide/colanic/teichoic acid biosynthesis glycosyltransferase
MGRILLRRFTIAMQKQGFGWYRTLVIENGGSGPYFFRKLEILPELGYEIVAVASWNGAFATQHKYSLVDVACCHTRDELRELIRNKAVERVLLPTVDLKQGTISDIFEVCKDARVKLKLLSHESEELLRFSYVKDVAGITLYSSPRRKIESAKRLTKRILDLLGGSLITLLFSPILLSAAFAILIEDGRPVLYRQRRALAKGKREFDVLKFRTMVKGAEKKQAELYQKNLVSGGLFLMKHDPRLLKVGKLLRKFSIDELPQLFNVLKGEMSLVGPRPLSIDDLNNITPSNRLGGYYELRANALPGMTGLWQISGRREISFKEMVLLDLYYIENQSVMFDLEILFATIPVVLFGKGAY